MWHRPMAYQYLNLRSRDGMLFGSSAVRVFVTWPFALDSCYAVHINSLLI